MITDALRAQILRDNWIRAGKTDLHSFDPCADSSYSCYDPCGSPSVARVTTVYRAGYIQARAEKAAGACGYCADIPAD